MPHDPRIDLATLVHRYADAVARRDVDQWVGCWAEEASWTLRAGQPVAGRDAIVALFNSVLERLVIAVQNILNGEVDIDAGGVTASGRWYIIEHLLATDGATSMVLAYYDDTYVRRDGRWLFTDRVLVPSYQGPPDLSAWRPPSSPARSPINAPGPSDAISSPSTSTLMTPSSSRYSSVASSPW